MKRIKDFLYNWNDIVIIILIILAAAALITWRVNKIMEYPSTLVNNVTDADATDSEATDGDAEATTDAETTDAENTDGEGADAEATTTDGDAENAETTDGEGTDTENSDSESTDAEANTDTESQTTETQPTNTYVEPGSGPRDSDIWENGHLKSSVTVTTAQGTAYDAVDSLIAAGLFTSFDDYFAVCMRVGVDSSRIQAATFTFDAGQTQEDIVKQVTM